LAGTVFSPAGRFFAFFSTTTFVWFLPPIDFRCVSRIHFGSGSRSALPPPTGDLPLLFDTQTSDIEHNGRITFQFFLFENLRSPFSGGTVKCDASPLSSPLPSCPISWILTRRCLPTPRPKRSPPFSAAIVLEGAPRRARVTGDAQRSSQAATTNSFLLATLPPHSLFLPRSKALFFFFSRFLIPWTAFVRVEIPSSGQILDVSPPRLFLWPRNLLRACPPLIFF